MPKIESVDALIDRIRVAFPGVSQKILDDYQNLMLTGQHDEALNRLDRFGWGWHQEKYVFSAKEILEVVDEDELPIAEKLAALVSKARDEVAEAAIYKVRNRLAKDFRETYPEAGCTD